MDISELPGNSHSQQKVRTEKVTTEVRTEKLPPKKVEKVVTTDAIRKKKPMGKRFAETFIRGHAKNAWEFVLMDVLVPAAKKMIADSVSQGVERMVYGESLPRSSRYRDDRRASGSTLVAHTSYDRISDPRDRRDEPRLGSRGRHDFDDIILATRAEAEIVLERMFFYCDKYDQVTVADLYELVGVVGSFTDQRYGWTDMHGSDIQRLRGGEYRLVLPPTVPLK